MNFVVDESVDRPVVVGLREAGHTLLYVAELSPALPDVDVLGLANAYGYVLITADNDFGSLIFQEGRLAHGVILLRLDGLSPERKATITVEAVAKHHDRLRGSFTVIEPGMVRVRRVFR